MAENELSIPDFTREVETRVGGKDSTPHVRTVVCHFGELSPEDAAAILSRSPIINWQAAFRKNPSRYPEGEAVHIDVRKGGVGFARDPKVAVDAGLARMTQEERDAFLDEMREKYGSK